VLYSEIVRREEARRVYCGDCAGQGWVMQPERVEGGGVRGVYRTCARCKGTGWACG
jgi:DnaJ-class molecular chaperone